MSWFEIARKFADLHKITGRGKKSSGTLIVDFNLTPGGSGIGVEFGGYDIGSWSRHHYIGPFKTEQEALQAAEAELKKAEEIVSKDQQDDVYEI